MTYLLQKPAAEQLGSNSRLTTNVVNPNNLAGLKFDKGIQLPKDWKFTQASADKEIDKFTKISETLVQNARVAKAAKAAIKLQTALIKEMESLREATYETEAAIEKAFARWQTLMHKLENVRLQASVGHGAEVAESNIAYAKFSRRVNERLSNSSNTAKGGTGGVNLNQTNLQLVA